MSYFSLLPSCLLGCLSPIRLIYAYITIFSDKNIPSGKSMFLHVTAGFSYCVFVI